MKLIGIGTLVKFINDTSEETGIIKATCVVDNELKYVVELSRGRWDEDSHMYFRLAVVDTSWVKSLSIDRSDLDELTLYGMQEVPL